MRHHQQGETELGLPPFDLGDDGTAGHRVQPGGRLVQHDELGLGGQRPGQRDPALLPARELPGQSTAELLVVREADRAQPVGYPLR